ncbi:MAG: F0F1 ATP synthase subunit A [Planctomycetes bacterium]|nr:F0F1 ATP synthase subunit A [Planctomycetota bacterium]
MSLLSYTPLAISASSGGESQNPFEVLYGHIVAQSPVEFLGMQWWNFQWFQVAAIVLVFLVFAPVRKSVQQGNGGVHSKVLAGWVTWIRDEMVYPNMGEKEGRKFLPFFLSLFFFILFMNAFGLIPAGASATASVYVCLALATITFSMMVIGGMIAQGPIKYWVNLVPHGTPGWLLPLIYPLELIGLLIKPIALTVRLAANMTGGHLVLLSFMGLAFYFGSTIGIGVGLAVTPVSLALAVFIMIIEGFVALLQAYIFTLLSIIFVSHSMHPDH